jgi:predicted DNA-binding transcriptional regulator AlpA
MSAEPETRSSDVDIYLKAAQVRQRYGDCSGMWIRRRIADAGFPEPIFLGGLRFWKLSDLELWEVDQKNAPKARPARDMKQARAAQ